MTTTLPHYGGTRAVDIDALTSALLSGGTVSANGTHYAGSGILVPLPGHVWGCATSDPLIRPRLAEWVRGSLPTVTAVGASPWRYLRSLVYPYGQTHIDVVEAWSDADEIYALEAARARGIAEVWHAGRLGWIDSARRAA